MTVEETQGQTWLDMGSVTMSKDAWRWGSGNGTWKNLETKYWGGVIGESEAEGKSRGDVNEPDGRAREAKGNTAKLKTKPGT